MNKQEMQQVLNRLKEENWKLKEENKTLYERLNTMAICYGEQLVIYEEKIKNLEISLHGLREEFYHEGRIIRSMK